MMTPFDVWAPMFRAPFSGDVTQEITPRILSPDIKGVPAIEHRIQTEVASYGKQLGKVLEALQLLAEKTDTPLPEIEALIEGVEAVKTSSSEDFKAEAEAALDRLRAADERAYQSVLVAAQASVEGDQ